MNPRQTWFGLVLGFLVMTTIAWGLLAPKAEAQKARAEPRYEYRVVPFRYHPNDRIADDARATRFERLLNEYARNG